jgi:hypothetical protein
MPRAVKTPAIRDTSKGLEDTSVTFYRMLGGGLNMDDEIPELRGE